MKDKRARGALMIVIKVFSFSQSHKWSPIKLSSCS